MRTSMSKSTRLKKIKAVKDYVRRNPHINLTIVAQVFHTTRGTIKNYLEK